MSKQLTCALDGCDYSDNEDCFFENSDGKLVCSRCFEENKAVCVTCGEMNYDTIDDDDREGDNEFFMHDGNYYIMVYIDEPAYQFDFGRGVDKSRIDDDDVKPGIYKLVGKVHASGFYGGGGCYTADKIEFVCEHSNISEYLHCGFLSICARCMKDILKTAEVK